jgi:hypothetical protein
MKTLVCLYLSLIVNVFQFEMNLDLPCSIVVEMECQV